MKEFHRISNLFPLMEGAEFEELKQDIAANGLREAIWLHPDGSILDGRNRYRACLEVGIEPHFRTWDEKGSLVTFILSMNLHRRHLTSSQRAVIALETLPFLEKEAKERQGTRTDITEIFPESSGEARHYAAQIAQTNPRYVSDAKKLQRDAPDLLAEVKSGNKTLPQAKREYVKRQRKESPPLPSSKYRVLYADPPWGYSNTWSGGDEGFSDRWTSAQTHYPTMTIAELCDIGPRIKDITEDNAVLFLWVTSPMLEECFEVVNAWGFKYKTSFVWDKVGHNFGHYNSVRHEFLLICTKGSCTPDSDTLIDSVQSIKKSKVHSEKPEEFRTIIDTLYTHGKKLELFARADAEGWETWGNEPS